MSGSSAGRVLDVPKSKAEVRSPQIARRHGETITLLDLRNSGDTAGPMSRVVGYGSFLVSAASGG